MSLSKLAVRRLTTLANFMDRLPKKANKHFHMRQFFTHHGADNHPEIPKRGKVPTKALTLCGTTACAAGWATAIPAFRRQGLRLVIDKHGHTGVHFGRIGISNWESIIKFFYVTYEDCDYLFGMSVDASTPKKWARHCRRFIKANT